MLLPNVETFIGCESSFEEASVVLYGAPFVAVLIPRLAQAAGMGVVEVLCICFMTKYVSQMKRVF